MSFFSVTVQLFDGFKQTLAIFALTLVFSMPLGLVITFGSMSRFAPLKLITRLLVWIIRGTPLMLQVIIVFYVPGLLFNAPYKNRLLAVIIAFVINYAAYFSEIYRGGIESILIGQYEAGYVLGMKRSQVFFKIILPQVVKRILPPVSNEVITLVKDTSLARAIAHAEIIMIAEQFTNKGLIWPLFYTGVYYLIFCGLLTLLFSHIEKRLDYYRG